jgi:hypothetical protein
MATMADSIKKGVAMISVPDVGRAFKWHASIGFRELARYEDEGVVNFGIVSFGQAELMLNAGGTSGRCAIRRLCLGLGLQLGVVFLDERPDLVRHGEQLRPLLLVEGDRKTAKAIDRNAALLADLEAHASATLALETFIFGFEPLELGFQILVCHLDSSIRVPFRNPVSAIITPVFQHARESRARVF